MTKKYKEQMWRRYLMNILNPPEKRIMDNPAVFFKKKVERGD